MFTTRVPKPKASETWNGVPRTSQSSNYTKVGKPNASENWVKVKLETAPASNLADIAEADSAVVDDSNSL